MTLETIIVIVLLTTILHALLGCEPYFAERRLPHRRHDTDRATRAVREGRISEERERLDWEESHGS